MTRVHPFTNLHYAMVLRANCSSHILSILQIIAICDIVIAIGDRHETLRQIEVPAGSGRQPARAGAGDDPAGSGSRHRGGDGIAHQPELSIPNRIGRTAAPHQYHSPAAGKVKVHPGYLVEDPEGYHAELLSDIRTQEEKLDLWLIAGSDRFRKDPELCRALRSVAMYKDSRSSLLLLESVLETPVLMERLLEILRPPEHQPAEKVHALPQRKAARSKRKAHTTRNSVK
jgi:hypothetical protein